MFQTNTGSVQGLNRHNQAGKQYQNNTNTWDKVGIIADPKFDLVTYKREYE